MILSLNETFKNVTSYKDHIKINKLLIECMSYDCQEFNVGWENNFKVNYLEYGAIHMSISSPSKRFMLITYWKGMIFYILNTITITY